MNIWLLLLALFASLSGATYNCGHCATGQCYGTPPNQNQCHQCDADYYLGTDGNCASCGTVAPCPAGQYWDETKCGVPALHMYHDNGCRVCTDCVTGEGPLAKAWGICGGPSPYTSNPDPECLTPGQALCKACYFDVASWQYTQTGDNGTFCDDVAPDDWLTSNGGALSTCCQAAQALEGVAPGSGGCAYCSVPAIKSCLFNSVINCLGIYTPPGGWPLPTPYPPSSVVC